MSIAEQNIEKKLGREISGILKHAHLTMPNYSTNITYSEFLSNKLLMISVIREGVPYSVFSLIQDLTPFSTEDWSHFLDISTKTLNRYKTAATHFKPIHSEKIIEMAEVTRMGVDVFGQMAKFKLWLDTPNFALGSIKPIELLQDSYGKDMVMAELTRINYGILV